MAMDVPVFPARPVRPLRGVVDDMRQVVHVESAGSHVGGDEQLQVTLTELLHHQVTLLLRQLAVQGVGIVAVLDELVGYLLCLLAGAAEDDAVDLRVVVDDTFQGEILVLRMHHIIQVVHVLVPFVPCADGDFLRVSEVVLGDTRYLGTHRGGEEERVAVLGHIRQDGVDAVGEPHVEHLVRLVHHHVADGAELHGATLHEVQQTARSSHDDVYPLLEVAYLALYRRAAIDGQHTQAVHVF